MQGSHVTWRHWPSVNYRCSVVWTSEWQCVRQWEITVCHCVNQWRSSSSPKIPNHTGRNCRLLIPGSMSWMQHGFISLDSIADWLTDWLSEFIKWHNKRVSKNCKVNSKGHGNEIQNKTIKSKIEILDKCKQNKQPFKKKTLKDYFHTVA